MDFDNELLNSYYKTLIAAFGGQESEPGQQVDQKAAIKQKIEVITKQVESLKEENRQHLDKISKNNGVIEINEIELRKLQDQLKAIVAREQDPINLFKEAVIKKTHAIQLSCGIKEQLTYMLNLVKKLQTKKVQISINKHHSGEFSLMIESEKMDPETKQDVILLKTLFNMLKSIL